MPNPIDGAKAQIQKSFSAATAKGGVLPVLRKSIQDWVSRLPENERSYNLALGNNYVIVATADLMRAKQAAAEMEKSAPEGIDVETHILYTAEYMRAMEKRLSEMTPGIILDQKRPIPAPSFVFGDIKAQTIYSVLDIRDRSKNEFSFTFRCLESGMGFEETMKIAEFWAKVSPFHALGLEVAELRDAASPPLNLLGEEAWRRNLSPYWLDFNARVDTYGLCYFSPTLPSAHGSGETIFPVLGKSEDWNPNMLPYLFEAAAKQQGTRNGIFKSVEAACQVWNFKLPFEKLEIFLDASQGAPLLRPIREDVGSNRALPVIFELVVKVPGESARQHPWVILEGMFEDAGLNFDLFRKDFAVKRKADISQLEPAHYTFALGMFDAGGWAQVHTQAIISFIDKYEVNVLYVLNQPGGTLKFCVNGAQQDITEDYKL